MGNSATKRLCVVCFEKRRKGLACSNDHFLCHNCFPPYVTSLIEDAGRMADNDFEIICCCPGCTAAPWSSHEVRLMLSGELLERYIDALIRHIHILDNDKDVQTAIATRAVVVPKISDVAISNDDASKLMKSVIDCLSLSCPFCHTAIDPNPDGCSAMRCGLCSKYFCLLCLKLEVNNSRCHAHVRVCPNNPSKNVYASKNIRERAHKLLQIQAVRSVLCARLGNKWRQHKHTPVVLSSIKKVLKSCNITDIDILKVVIGVKDEIIAIDRQVPLPLQQQVGPVPVPVRVPQLRWYEDKFIVITICCSILLGVVLIPVCRFRSGDIFRVNRFLDKTVQSDQSDDIVTVYSNELVIYEPSNTNTYNNICNVTNADTCMGGDNDSGYSVLGMFHLLASFIYQFYKIGYLLYIFSAYYVYSKYTEANEGVYGPGWVRGLQMFFINVGVALYISVGLGIGLSIGLVEISIYIYKLLLYTVS